MKSFLNKCLKIIIYFFENMWLYDPKVSIQGEKWRIHNFDADQNFPSVPHMHCRTNKRKKLDIYTGEIYIKSNSKSIDKADKKEISRLWSNKKFRTIVYNERIRYFEKYNKEYEKNIPMEYINEYELYKKRG